MEVGTAFQVDTPQPREQCDMRPRKRCRPVMRLMPKLVPGSECTTVPREVCVTVSKLLGCEIHATYAQQYDHLSSVNTINT